MRVRTRWLIIVGVLLALSFGGALFLRQQPPPEKPHIGFILPLTANVGPSLVNSAQLALEHSTLRDEVELMIYNTREEGLDQSAVWNERHTHSAVQDASVVAVVGGLSSSQAAVSIPITNRASLLFVSSLATAPHLTKPGYLPGAPGSYYPTGERNFYRTIPSDEIQGQVAARWLAANGAETVFLIWLADDVYSNQLAGIFESQSIAQGMTVAGQFAFTREGFNDDTPAAVVAAVRAARPDAVYFPLVTSDGHHTILTALREALPELAIMGGDGMTYIAYPEDAYPLLNGIQATIAPARPQLLPDARAFVSAYEAAYNETPGAAALTTYNAFTAVLAAVAASERPFTREGVLASMDGLGVVEGGGGTIAFTDTGDIKMLAFQVVRFDNGNWLDVDIIR